jgi:hypothetical protein
MEIQGMVRELSWRTMAKRAGQTVVALPMYNAMNGEVLPKLAVVKAIVIGCCGDDDLSVFVTAWRRIAAGTIQRASVNARFLGAQPNLVVICPCPQTFSLPSRGRKVGGGR